jgi:signal transduction histidine kinase
MPALKALSHIRTEGALGYARVQPGTRGEANRFREILKNGAAYVLPWIVLAILLVYSYADFFQHTYGFRWRGGDGTITAVFVNASEPTLHVGDRLVRVGPVDFQTFHNDLRAKLFEGFIEGQFVPVTVQRGDGLITVQWMLPGLNPGEIRDQFLGPWLLAYSFWFAGTLTLLVVRPRDERWFLLGAFDFIAAIGLITYSGLSAFHIWDSALVVRMAVWISLPVFLHLHWVFPRPLGKLHPALVWGIYAVTAAMVMAQWFQRIPPYLAIMALLLALAGSLVLLVIHLLRQPDIRRDLWFILIIALVACIPLITLVVVTAHQGAIPAFTGVALLSFSALPFAYLYIAQRRHLGGLEIRVNRWISIYAFLILLAAVMAPLLALTARLPVYSPDQTLIIAVSASILTTALSLWAFPIFQNFVERRVLGIRVPSSELQQRYSSQITSSTSFSSLTRLLNNDIMPSLLVRQFVFLLLDNGSTRILLRNGVTTNQIPNAAADSPLQSWTDREPLFPSIEDPNFAWIRLVLPLKVEQELLGFWLFGRRDPDDMYSGVEVPILQSFANQTAIALSNILQTNRLRAMYQADINRHENERLSLARELHDSVLNELAGMLMNADMESLPKNFQEGYKNLTERLREIVSELRPPMLNYGLKPAIEELADNLTDRSKENVNIIIDLQSAGDRYPLDKEQHLFRIVQEACENAVRHSHGNLISISGQLDVNQVELRIDDDGDGFQLSRKNTELYDLVSQRHFGLAGMLERAELIGAQIKISSALGVGTTILLNWKASEHQSPPGQRSGDFSS